MPRTLCEWPRRVVLSAPVAVSQRADHVVAAPGDDRPAVGGEADHPQLVGVGALSQDHLAPGEVPECQRPVRPARREQAVRGEREGPRRRAGHPERVERLPPSHVDQPDRIEAVHRREDPAVRREGERGEVRERRLDRGNRGERGEVVKGDSPAPTADGEQPVVGRDADDFDQVGRVGVVGERGDGPIGLRVPDEHGAVPSGGDQEAPLGVRQAPDLAGMPPGVAVAPAADAMADRPRRDVVNHDPPFAVARGEREAVVGEADRVDARIVAGEGGLRGARRGRPADHGRVLRAREEVRSPRLEQDGVHGAAVPLEGPSRTGRSRRPRRAPCCRSSPRRSAGRRRRSSRTRSTRSGRKGSGAGASRPGRRG